MATRGFEDVTASDIATRNARISAMPICCCGHTVHQHEHWNGKVRHCTSINCACREFTVDSTQSPQQGEEKPSKYRNVKTRVGDIVFDSKREAAYWLELQAREKAGDITALERQKVYPLYCPAVGEGAWCEVATYQADYVFVDAAGVQHVQDLKGGKSQGTRTRLYALKKKWMELQNGIVVEEVQ